MEDAARWVAVLNMAIAGRAAPMDPERRPHRRSSSAPVSPVLPPTEVEPGVTPTVSPVLPPTEVEPGVTLTVSPVLPPTEVEPGVTPTVTVNVGILTARVRLLDPRVFLSLRLLDQLFADIPTLADRTALAHEWVTILRLQKPEVGRRVVKCQRVGCPYWALARRLGRKRYCDACEDRAMNRPERRRRRAGRATLPAIPPEIKGPQTRLAP